MLINLAISSIDSKKEYWIAVAQILDPANCDHIFAWRKRFHRVHALGTVMRVNLVGNATFDAKLPNTSGCLQTRDHDRVQNIFYEAITWFHDERRVRCGTE